MVDLMKSRDSCMVPASRSSSRSGMIERYLSLLTLMRWNTALVPSTLLNRSCNPFSTFSSRRNCKRTAANPVATGAANEVPVLTENPNLPNGVHAERTYAPNAQYLLSPSRLGFRETFLLAPSQQKTAVTEFWRAGYEIGWRSPSLCAAANTRTFLLSATLIHSSTFLRRSSMGPCQPMDRLMKSTFHVLTACLTAYTIVHQIQSVLFATRGTVPGRSRQSMEPHLGRPVRCEV